MTDFEEIRTKFYTYSLSNMLNRYNNNIDTDDIEEVLELDYIDFIYNNKEKYVTDEFTIEDFATLLYRFQKELINELVDIANKDFDESEESEEEVSENLKLHIINELGK
jgi:hypothetical protein